MTTVDKFLGEAQRTLGEMADAVAELNAVVEAEADAKRRLREIDAEIKVEESMVMVDLERQAKEKTGPLAGIAKTSKAYGATIEVALAGERENGGALGELAQRQRQLTKDVAVAEVERQQLANTFSALKYSANLQAAMLKALTSPA